MGVKSEIYGLESDARLAAATRRRLRRRRNVTIVDGDAPSNLPHDGMLFFLFNPFDESTTRRFAAAAAQLAQDREQGLTIIYLNCKHVAAFLDASEFTVEIGELRVGAAADSQAYAVITTP